MAHKSALSMIAVNIRPSLSTAKHAFTRAHNKDQVEESFGFMPQVLPWCAPSTRPSAYRTGRTPKSRTCGRGCEHDKHALAHPPCALLGVGCVEPPRPSLEHAQFASRVSRVPEADHMHTHKHAHTQTQTCTHTNTNMHTHKHAHAHVSCANTTDAESTNALAHTAPRQTACWRRSVRGRGTTRATVARRTGWERPRD